ncbi:hypothetical protein A3850_001665 [Lewinella sp. 4G2]|nr:hypothetical protein A3850_001665 [Lewinella sp. 4G2]
MIGTASLPAQTLEVDDSFDAETLVRDVFTSGSCETITNIKQIGESEGALGFFKGGLSSVGFDEGIILSTGKAKLAVGPNNYTSTGFRFDETFTSDQDLNVASTGDVYDRAGIEFDFVPLTPEVTFRYVFASEEYCEFVGQNFNDIFGFFISGPGIRGPFSNRAINLALVPGTDQAVSINNVNFRSNSQYYLDNEFPDIRESNRCRGGTGRGPRFELIEYDGQTTVLEATVRLRVCQTYHIRLVVADITDNQFDSAVFLEAGSFNLGGSVSLEDDVAGDEPPVVYEGCSPVNFRVQRGPDSNPNSPQTVNYRIGRNSTATRGRDFASGNGTVVIPAGEDFALVPVTAFADNVNEGTENIWFYLDVPCACFTDSIQFLIKEPEPLDLGLEEAFYCPGETARLDALVEGGVPPFRYNWSFGSAEANPELASPLPAEIAVTVSDNCGQTQRKTVNTFRSEPPRLAAEAQDFRGCADGTVLGDFFLTGQGPFTVTYSVSGGGLETQVFAEDSLQTWSFPRGGDYRLTRIQDQACTSRLDTAFKVSFLAPFLSPRTTNPSCAGLTDGTVELTHVPTTAPYTYTFNGQDTTQLSYDDLPAGTYRVGVTDSLGCTDERDVELMNPDPVLLPEINCENIRRAPLRPSAQGGLPPYSYSVNGTNYFDETGFDRLRPGEFYQLYVRDAAGCVVTDPSFFWPQAAPRMARLPTLVPQELAGTARIAVDYFVPDEQIFSYSWSPPELFDCPDCPETNVMAPETQSISLAVEDIYGCRDSLVTQVAIDGRVPVFVPNIFSPNNDGMNDFVSVFANPQQVAEIESFRIFNRWGALLWEDGGYLPNRAGRGWDGTFNGQAVTSGAFIWSVTFRLRTGEVQSASGSVVLMR